MSTEQDPSNSVLASDEFDEPAARKPAVRRRPEKKIRFTLDLQQEQHMYLKLFALQNGTEASKICRALLYLLEVDKPLQERVLDELFAEDSTIL